MKQMKIALVAIFAIFMGTTFTSCLDSDDSPMSYSELVNISYLGRVTSDAGYTLEVQNPTAMQLEGDFPSRALISWQEIDGEDYTPGKSSYKAYFAGYYIIYSIGETFTSEVTSETPINKIETNVIGVGASGNYLNLIFNITYDDNTDAENDFVLCFEEVKDGALYCKLVHREAVDTSKAKTSAHAMSFYMPSKTQLQSQFQGLTFTGDDNNIIKLFVYADGPNDSKLDAVEFAVRLN